MSALERPVGGRTTAASDRTTNEDLRRCMLTRRDLTCPCKWTPVRANGRSDREVSERARVRAVPQLCPRGNRPVIAMLAGQRAPSNPLQASRPASQSICWRGHLPAEVRSSRLVDPSRNTHVHAFSSTVEQLTLLARHTASHWHPVCFDDPCARRQTRRVGNAALAGRVGPRRTASRPSHGLIRCISLLFGSDRAQATKPACSLRPQRVCAPPRAVSKAACGQSFGDRFSVMTGRHAAPQRRLAAHRCPTMAPPRTIATERSIETAEQHASDGAPSRPQEVRRVSFMPAAERRRRCRGHAAVPFFVVLVHRWQSIRGAALRSPLCSRCATVQESRDRSCARSERGVRHTHRARSRPTPRRASCRSRSTGSTSGTRSP